MSDPRPVSVLFVCTGNSARSQIARALLERDGGPAFTVASAGTQPKGVNPLTVRVLGELGIDWSQATSTAVETLLDRDFDYVVTVCDRARESCPVFPGARRTLHWDLDDPAEAVGTEADRLAAFRATRTEVMERMGPFIAQARGAR